MKKMLSGFKPLFYLVSLLSRVLFPTRNLSTRNKKILVFSSTLVIFIFLPIIGFTLTHLRGAEAAWFDSKWSFRKSIAITAHTSAETNVYVNLTGANSLDTSDTSRFQADCGDLRFTDASGNNLPYFIVSGCGSSTTVVHVFYEIMPAGAQTIYYYYGNPQAPNGFSSSDFSTEASNYTIGSLGSEEAGAAPIAYWRFDDGAGTTAIDSSSNRTNGALNSFDSNPSTRSGWMKDDQCISGKCLLFNGSSSYVSTADRDAYSPSVNSISISFWAKIPTNATATGNGSCGAGGAYMLAKGNTSNWEWGFENDNNTLLCLDLFQTSGTAYKLISVSRTVNDGQWHHYTATIQPGTLVTLYIDGVLVTSASSGFSGSMGNGTQPVEIGRRGDGNYAGEYVDDVKIYQYVRTAAQVKADYDSRGGTAANVFGASDASKNLTNALVGHWKMDETSWVNDCSSGVVADSSGNGFNGLACPTTTGPTGGGVGKFGNAPDLDGSNDFVFVSNFTKNSSVFTISAWVYADTRPTWGTILKNWGNSNRGEFHFGLENTGGDIGLHIIQNDASEITIRENTAIPLGSWQHVVAVADGKYLHLYRNGVEVATPVAYDGTLRTTFNCLGIGAKPNDTCTGSDAGSPGFWDGKIDEARIYNRALSPREIEQLYDYTPGPIMYLNFEEGTGTSVKDRSGGNNSATWTGTAPYWSTGKYGKGGTCDGSSSYINTSSGLYTLNGGSVDLWFQYRGTGTGSSIFTGSYGGSGAQRAPSLYVGAGNVLFWEFANQITKSTGVPIEVNKWYHVAFTYDSNFNVNVYVNGIKVDSATASTPGSFYSQVHFCHYGNFGSNFFNGKIDEARIYNYAISQKQVVADMNGSHPAPGSPVGSATGYWKFDEGYGTIANNSGNAGGNIPGTLTNMASVATAVSGWSQSGKYNKALRFDGSNDFVSIANNPQALRFTGDLSISAWINLTNNSAVHDIVSKKGAGGQYGYRLNTTASGNVQFEISSDGSTVRAATSSAVLAVNKWYHVVGVYNPGNSITVYIDGKKDGQVTTSMPASVFNSSANVNIGAENNGASNFFAGAIDDPKIYSGVLTSDQVRLDFNRGSSQVMGSTSDTSGLTGGSVASNSASAEYCIPGDTATCNAPVGRWDFEEKSGSFKDTSGNNNSMAPGSTTKYAKGKMGGAIGFDGTINSGVTAGDVLDLIGTPLTISAWVKPRSFAQYAPIVEKLATGGNYRLVIDDSTGVISFGIRNSGGTFQATTSTPYKLSLNTWNHIEVTYDNSTTVKIYLNGVLVVTDNTYAISRGDTSQDFEFGYNSNNAVALDGELDQVRIFDYVRTPGQVAWDYNRGAPAGWWKFDECQGSTIHDSSGNNIHGTWSGAGGGTQTAVGTCITASTAWGNGATGKFNSSLNFDGVDDGVLVNNSTVLFDSTKPFTAGGWAYLSSIGAASNVYPTFFTFTTDQSTGFILFFIASNGIRFGSSSNFVYADTANHTASDFVGKWTHIMLVYDGVSRSSLSSYKLYLNGISEPLVAHTIGIVNNENAIGTDPSDGDSYFPGKIDDVRIYKYALTRQQVLQVMNQGSAIRFGPSTGAP